MNTNVATKANYVYTIATCLPRFIKCAVSSFVNLIHIYVSGFALVTNLD